MTQRLRRRLSVMESDTRDSIIFKKNIDWMPETHTPYKRIEYFGDVTKYDIEKLLAKGFKVTLQDPEFMPSIANMLAFIGRYSNYHFHGYVIGPYCSNTKVSNEGI